MLRKLSIILLCFTSFSYNISKSNAATLTSSEIQFERLITLKQDRAPDAPFPELLQQFIENSTAIAEILEGIYLETFNAIYNHALLFFGENGENLTLAHFNVVHFYYASIIQKSQFKSFISKDSLFNDFKNALNSALNENFYPSGLSNRLALNRIRPLMYIEHQLYPYTIVSETGDLPIKILNSSFRHDTRICALPLILTKFDGELDEPCENFLGHDCAHASPEFNGIWERNENGINRYNALLDLINQNQDLATQNLDHFCLFFIEHENYRFYKGKFQDLETDCNFVLNKLLTDTLSILNDYTLKENDIMAIDVFKQCCPNKTEPFTLETNVFRNKAKEFGLSDNTDLVTKVINSRFGTGYNILFDIQSMLKDSNIDFQIWKDDQFNAEEMSTIITQIFNDFKERYEGKF
jgi:hypothetical protein